MSQINESTAAPGGKNNPSANESVMETSETRETLEAIATLFETFTATDDTEYLDTAIALAEEEPASSDKGSQQLWRVLKELLHTAKARLERTEQTKETETGDREKHTELGDAPQEGSSSHILTLYAGPEDVPETVELIQTLYNTFTESGDADYLDSAIGLAEEIVPSDTHVVPILNFLLETRNAGPKSIEQVDEPTVGLQKGKGKDIAGGPQDGDIKEILAQAGFLGPFFTPTEFIEASQEILISEHLDVAIGLARNMTTRDKSMQPLLDTLMRTRDTSRQKNSEKANANLPDIAQMFAGHNPQGSRLGRRFDIHSQDPLEFDELGEAFKDMVRGSGAITDVDGLIGVAEALHALFPSVELPPDTQGVLAALSVEKWQRTQAPEDLQTAIDRTEGVLAVTPKGLARSDHLQELAHMLYARYRRLGALEDINKAIQCDIERAELLPPGDLDWALLLATRGKKLIARYRRLGTLADLELAISSCREALPYLKDDDNRAMALHNLSELILFRYIRFGRPDDLEEAYTLSEESARAAPSLPMDGWKRFINIGSLSMRRYKLHGALEDLQQSILQSEAILAEIPPNDEHIGLALSNLAEPLAIRYTRLNDPEDIERAIKLGEEAIRITPLDHPLHPDFLAKLATYLASSYPQSEDPDNLQRAIELSRSAVLAMPQSHVDRPWAVINMCSMLIGRYKNSMSPEDLNQAIEWSEEGVATIPPNHPHRGDGLIALAEALSYRISLTNSTEEFQQIRRLCYEAFHCQISQPQTRIKAARLAVIVLAAVKMWEESSSLLEGAIKLLPRVSSRSVRRDDQEHSLSEFTGLAADTVAYTLQAGEEASHCLRLLELGRGILMGLVIDCRSDLSKLRLQHPEIYDQFHRLRTEIDSPMVKIEVDGDYSYDLCRRRRENAVLDLEKTLASIRELPGFEGLQLPPHSEELTAMASEGSIVIVNSTQLRSDAIIVTSSGIKAIRLPKLSREAVDEQMSQLRQLVRGPRATYRSRNDDMAKFLLWLWDVAVEPVLKALQLDTIRLDVNGELPRVWWIGVGPLAMAPFHAAGDHSRRSKRNTMSRVISSYTPTIKALSYAREKRLEFLTSLDSRILLVTMPTTPGRAALKNATKEAEDIARVVEGNTVTTTRIERPSTAQVLSEIPSYHAVHFACHGVSDARKPSNSSLLLRKDDGTELGAPDRLTVEQISNTPIHHAQIAYLSACSTAENALGNLVDESIYIASGFQLAGFSHVLATQWISDDNACLEVSGDFYKLLFDGKPAGGKGGHRKVSASFHTAVKKLRDQFPRQPILWGSFIHTGA